MTVRKMLTEPGKWVVENSENLNKEIEYIRKSQREKEYNNWTEKYTTGA